jgi:hypothetical protein
VAISNPKASSNPKKTGANSAKDTLDWRIKELRAFDVSRILDRWDPVLESLHKSVNESLAEVLGNNSPDYRKFAIETFDATLPSDFGGRYSTEELQRAVQESVAQAIVTLDRVKALIRERSRQQPPSSAPPPASATAPAPAIPQLLPASTPPAAASMPPAVTPARAPVAPPAPAAVKPPAPAVAAAPVVKPAPVPAPPGVTSAPPQAAPTPAPAPVKAATPAAPPVPAPTPPAPQPAPQAVAASSPARVRVAVLGGETPARQAALDFIRQLGLQSDSSAASSQGGSKLFLERLDELRDLQYAVVLLPAQALDPASGLPKAAAPELLMEFGHVLAAVGRSRICFLLSGEAQTPAWQGIARMRMDDEGLWHLLLARAMKQAGLDVDLNRAI